MTVFETCHYIFSGRDENDVAIVEWIKQLAFYEGDLSHIDLSCDARFCEVKGVRKQAVLLGKIEDMIFPVLYPMILDNGLTINHGEYKNIVFHEDDYNEKL